ncbi:4'-phosphopantetheinyl transferase family protein [Bacillus pretiosus]|uniref:4'-phosphopantetheinyl transferase family protein n=1 Tax=Bacillus pretiosus TaxID=2983392 RepID=UPI003D64761E
MDLYGVFLNYDSEKDARTVDYLKKYISKEKLNRINRLKKQEDRIRSIVGDILIRWIVCEKYNLFNEELKFTTNEYGKPFLTNIDTNFNVSHSGSWVVAAISHLEVGIDIEKIIEIDMKIARNFFTPEENNSFIKLLPEQQLHHFYKLWTLKESYIKALGKGLSVPLDSFSINIDNRSITIFPQSPYNFRQYPLHDDYKLAVCTQEKTFPNCVKVIPLEQLIHIKSFI